MNIKTTFKAATKTEKISNHIIEQIRDIILSGQVKPGDKMALKISLIFSNTSSIFLLVVIHFLSERIDDA